MQTIQILALGKCKESYLRDACREYEKRLSRFCQLQVTELEPVSLPQNPSEKEIAAALEKEGAELLKRAKGFCIAMCIEGKQLDSPGLAKKLEQAAQGGDSGAVTFLIGKKKLVGILTEMSAGETACKPAAFHVGNDVSAPAGTGDAAGTDLPELSDFIRHQVS